MTLRDPRAPPEPARVSYALASGPRAPLRFASHQSHRRAHSRRARSLRRRLLLGQAALLGLQKRADVLVRLRIARGSSPPQAAQAAALQALPAQPREVLLLLPAVRANTSLRKLTLHHAGSTQYVPRSAREAETLVAARAQRSRS